MRVARISAYRTVAMSTEPTIASGRLRPRRFISSEIVETFSNPVKETMMRPTVPPTAPHPRGANGW